MSVKFLRKVAARKCPIHQAVLDKLQDKLLTTGYFSKDEVLEDLRFSAMSESIRWDYLREFVEEDLSIELIPVVSRFFKAYVKDSSGARVKTTAERVVSPEKYIAQGNGKRTAGYCSIEVDGGGLAIRRLSQKKAMTNGVGKAYMQFVEALASKGIADDSTQALLEDNQ